MSNLFEVSKYLKQQGIKLSGPLARQEGGNSLLYAFIDVSKDSKGHQKPSNILLKRITEELSLSGIEIKFILNSATLDHESGLRSTLLHAFPSLIRNSFLSFEEQGATVWIMPKSVAVREHMQEITSRIEIYLRNARVSLDEVKLTVDENLPSRTAILGELRIAAPATAEQLAERLSKKDFVKPPIDYLNRHLDALRLAEQIVCRTDNQYCLTASALKVLGTIKRRSSPDIKRLLDLATRGSLH